MVVELNIVIPVYNGADVLGATLAGLLPEATEALTITVVVNGSTDGSQGIATRALKDLREKGARTELISLEAASRTAALNAGDKVGDPSGHRLYLDQDVLLSEGAIQAILRAFNRGAQFVGGRASWRSPSWIVHAAMEAWNALPYVRLAPVTAGMYAVSAQGRGRWADWPAGVPDDKFARLNFHPNERVRLDDVEYSACAPSTFAGLVAARARYTRSNRALQSLTPEIASRDSGRGLANIAAVRLDRLVGFAALGAAELLARLRSR
jgi:glycosyltransferase involved in cell wall biosynthesis